MRFIPADTVHKILDYPSLVETLFEAHRGDKPLVERSEQHHESDDGEGRQTFLNLPAWLPGRAMGVKMITVMPENEKVWSLPTVHAVYQLFDGRNGEPVAAIDGTALTLRKTAADSALGAKLLAREDAASLLLLGAGAMAPHLIEAHRAVRPSITEVRIWNRTFEKAERLASELDLPGLSVEPVNDIEAAARTADVISQRDEFDRAPHSRAMAEARLPPGSGRQLYAGHARKRRRGCEAGDALCRLALVRRPPAGRSGAADRRPPDFGG